MRREECDIHASARAHAFISFTSILYTIKSTMTSYIIAIKSQICRRLISIENGEKSE
jgi:hypothetical protein